MSTEHRSTRPRAGVALRLLIALAVVPAMVPAAPDAGARPPAHGAAGVALQDHVALGAKPLPPPPPRFGGQLGERDEVHIAAPAPTPPPLPRHHYL